MRRRAAIGLRPTPNDVQGLSTRSVDDMIKAMGMTGVSESQVAQLCGEIDEQVDAFLCRPLEGEWRAPAGLNRRCLAGAPLAGRNMHQGQKVRRSGILSNRWQSCPHRRGAALQGRGLLG